ncbi:sentrin-specific protease 1-like [Olea europaea subsp. europaea]|uniref:Sentrin-specific protease 1-like n=1 Tax=Olea europaea subsp. europaea TaxID=158383 RepID=A0A8S0VK66_OLEEU|nr:sentrin-specific protease 1-like [Olea europaea subsp. europaea]
MVTLTCQIFFFSKIQVQTVQPNVDRKEKGKIDPSEDISIPYSLQPPSFDLGIGYTQPDDVQKQGSTSPDGRSELPVKRVSRPARILQSPFVVGEGKLLKHDDHVIVFEYFKGNIEEVDRSTFISWFQRGFKPKNKKKFNDEDDKIKPAFVIGSFPVDHKSWFYNLIHTESSLSSTHMDACFYYIRQLAKHGKNVNFRTTTTNSWFQHKIKDIYPAFMKDPQVLISELSLVNVITGHNLPLSTPWADVDHVFMPMLSTNKAHWMLGVLQFRSYTLTMFNSVGKIYRDWKVLEGIEPYVKILPALMNALGISKRALITTDLTPRN